MTSITQASLGETQWTKMGFFLLLDVLYALFRISERNLSLETSWVGHSSMAFSWEVGMWFCAER